MKIVPVMISVSGNQILVGTEVSWLFKTSFPSRFSFIFRNNIFLILFFLIFFILILYLHTFTYTLHCSYLHYLYKQTGQTLTILALYILRILSLRALKEVQHSTFVSCSKFPFFLTWRAQARMNRAKISGITKGDANILNLYERFLSFLLFRMSCSRRAWPKRIASST